MLKYLMLCQELIKQGAENSMKLVIVDSIQAFVIIKNVGVMINTDVNAKN